MAFVLLMFRFSFSNLMLCLVDIGCEYRFLFWLSYLFALAALGAQIYVMQVAFSKGRDTRSKFCGFPIARIGVAYLSAQFVLGPLFMKWA